MSLDDIKEGARKALNGLAVQTKAPRDISGFRFYKVRIGKRNGARMIVFVVTENNKVVPVLIRLKKDKIFGMNMAMNNPAVVGQINKNLDKILNDMSNHAYEEFSL